MKLVLLSSLGIDFVEAQKLWADPELLELRVKSDDELRFLVIGIIDNKHWTGVITYRGSTIRSFQLGVPVKKR